MLIEEPEQLETWLASVLLPIFHGDSSPLIKYIIALIRKGKTEEDLRKRLTGMLEVFLTDHTTSFVDQLLPILKAREYLAMQSDEDTMLLPFNVYAESSNSKLENSTLDESRISVGAHSDILSASDTDPHNSTLNTSNDTQATDESTNTLASGSCVIANLIRRSSGSTIEPRKSDDRSDRIPRRASRSPRRRRSRDHSRKSWSPIDPNSAHSRGNGRRTPPVWRRDEESYNRRRPRRSSSPSTRRRLSPRRYNNGRHGAYVPKNVNSPEKSERYRCRSPLSNDREEEDTDNRRDRDRPTRRSADDNEGDLRDTIRNRRRCKDFDERGLCLRGELCPFDHGQNPVVLQDVCGGSGVQIPAESNIDDLRLLRSARLMLDPEIQQHNTSIPAPPVGWEPLPPFPGPFGRGSPMVLPHPHGFPVPPRELINVPIMGLSGPQMLDTTGSFPRGPPPMGAFYHGQSQRGSFGNGWARGGGARRGGFDRSRLGAKPRCYMNCSLEVKRIPSSQNTIAELNTHFNRFGKIVNIQINFENDLEAALITFSSPNEALTAYKSTEAVLNNRFIRVFWHNKEKENELEQRLVTLEPNQEGNEDGDVLAVSVTVDNHHKLDATMSVEKAQALEAIKKSQEQLAAQQQLKKVQAEKKREALKFIHDLKKKKQMVLAEQIEQQKKMIHKLETNKSMKPEEKEELKTLIKNLQDSIEKLKDGVNVPGVPLERQNRTSIKQSPGKFNTTNERLQRIER